MTKENRERQYLNFRDSEKNYVAKPGRDHDLEKTDVLKKRAKESADDMLKKHPELAELDKVIETPVVKEEPKPKERKDVKEPKR